MSQARTCLACGYSGFDVAMTLIEVAEAEQRVVDVAITTAQDSHGRPTGMDVRQVRERFASEPRCRDRTACKRRVAALEPAVPQPIQPAAPPPADVAEPDPLPAFLRGQG